MAVASIEVPVNMTFVISEEAAQMCATMLEMYLNSHPDYDLRVTEREDGTLRYSVVKKDAPCVSG